MPCAWLLIHACQNDGIRASNKPVPARETLLCVGSTVPTNEDAAAFMVAVGSLATMCVSACGHEKILVAWSLIIVIEDRVRKCRLWLVYRPPIRAGSPSKHFAISLCFLGVMLSRLVFAFPVR